jgi:hypothetical protein
MGQLGRREIAKKPPTKLTDNKIQKKALTSMNKKRWLVLTITVWVACFTVWGLIYYINYYLPHGSMCPTGDIPPDPQYYEDLRGLNIPNWAKFFKNNGPGMLLGIVLLAAGFAISCKDSDKW